jgi:hypothetical protein
VATVKGNSGKLTSFAPLSLSAGSGPDTLVLKINQDAWQGSAQYTVKVDGVQIGGVFTASALRSSGQFDTLTLKGDWKPGAHRVEVNFLNDAWGGSAATDSPARAPSPSPSPRPPPPRPPSRRCLCRLAAAPTRWC